MSDLAVVVLADLLWHYAKPAPTRRRALELALALARIVERRSNEQNRMD